MPSSARKAVSAIAVAIMIIAWLVLRPARPAVIRRNFQVMGTTGQVIAVADNHRTADAAIAKAVEALASVERIMSYHDPNSELSVLNRLAEQEDYHASPHLFDVIALGVEMGRRSDGAFDITVGPLVDLWRQAKTTGKAPTAEETAAAKSAVGYDKLVVDSDRRTIRFAAKGMRIDLGGIAKGYGVDLAVEAMKAAGAAGGLVQVGGDIRCFGPSPAGNQAWKIGIQRPAAPGEVQTGEYAMVLAISDMAVSTSGDYQRFVVVDGIPYSHIISTATGGSAREFSSVTIIASIAAEADALATAASVMGKERAILMLEDADIAAILISPSPEY
ncbi:MAG TPA: FAD:protein FMN transferase, partial [Sedimentisphaerales bacterium]|nr:FAD:protein FMN transferase [Sedimentisphaerales bacterium]